MRLVQSGLPIAPAGGFEFTLTPNLLTCGPGTPGERVGRFVAAPYVDRLRCGDCSPGCLRYRVAPLITQSFTSCVAGEFTGR
jgi:hypothetical protein